MPRATILITLVSFAAVACRASTTSRSASAGTLSVECLKPIDRPLAGDSIENIYPVWSPNGEWIAFTGRRRGNFDIYRVRPDGHDLQRLTSDPAIDAHPAWSRDAQWLSFDSDRDGNKDAYVMSASGCAEQNVTRRPAIDGPVSWGPGDSTVHLDSSRDGDEAIYGASLTRAPNGTWSLGPVRALTVGPGRNLAPGWSPTGDRILFESRRDGNRELYVMHSDSARAHNVSRDPAPDFLGRWSPDASRIVFWSRRGDNEDVFTVGVDGRDLRRLTDHPARDRMPAWGPDGRRIVFSSD